MRSYAFVLFLTILLKAKCYTDFGTCTPMKNVQSDEDKQLPKVERKRCKLSKNAEKCKGFEEYNDPETLMEAFISAIKEPDVYETCYDQIPTVCLPFNVPKPEFNAPGMRISVAKCHEYMWEYNHYAMETMRKNKCRDLVSEIHNFLGDMQTYIIGGRPVDIQEFPHMGAVGWWSVDEQWLFLCGSTLISSKFVLTAAHCTYFSSPNIADPVPKIVRFSIDNILTTSGLYTIEPGVNITRIITHPQYSSPKKYFDIALMELEEELVFSPGVHPACLWTEEVNMPNAIITGWGKTAEKQSSDFERGLMAATVDIIDSQTCDDLLKSACNRNWCGLQDHQFCAGRLEGGVDSCQGDSGGPLQVKIRLKSPTPRFMYSIVGVVSFGVGCGREYSPGVYVKVSSFLDWIENTVWGRG